MPRIKPMPRSQAREDVQKGYDKMFGEGVDPVADPNASSATGTPGHYLSVWAHAPDVRNAIFNFAWAKASLDPKLRELALVRTGYVVGSQFVFSQHCKMARDVGVDPKKVTEIPFWPISELFDAKERAVLAFTDCIVSQQGRVHDRIAAALKSHISDKEVLELTYFTTLYITHALHCKALKLEYDDVPDRIVEIPIPESRKKQDWTDPSWAKNAELK